MAPALRRLSSICTAAAARAGRRAPSSKRLCTIACPAKSLLRILSADKDLGQNGGPPAGRPGRHRGEP